MSYKDVTQAIDTYGEILNKDFSNEANQLRSTYYKKKGISPYSSGAYGPSAQSIYSNIPETYDPRSMYEIGQETEDQLKLGLRGVGKQTETTETII